MKSFKGVCLWDSLFVSGLNQCRTWNCFACYGIFSEVGTAILAGSVPGLGSSKVLVLDTWYLMQNLEYLVLTCTWHFEIQKYLVLTCTWRQSTWYLSKYFQVLLSNQHVYSGLNLEYVSFNKSPLNTIMMNYWNGSYFVLTAWGLHSPDIKTGLPPCVNNRIHYDLSMSPAQMGRIEGPRDAPSYIPNQSPTPRRKLELSRKGPSFVPVISPMTKAAPLRNHRKGQMAKQPKS